MAFEGLDNSEKNRSRARTVIRMIDEGRYDTIPRAVRQVLINERITFEPDVQRVMRELGPIIEIEKEKIADEKQIVDEHTAELAAIEEQERKESAGEHIISPDGEDLTDR